MSYVGSFGSRSGSHAIIPDGLVRFRVWPCWLFRQLKWLPRRNSPWSGAIRCVAGWQAGRLPAWVAGMQAGWLLGRQASRLAGWLADKHPHMETGKGTKDAKKSELATLFVLGWLAAMETCFECRLPIPLLSIVAIDSLLRGCAPKPVLHEYEVS